METTRKSILIVDDEEDITWSISKGFSKNKRNIEIICTNCGSEALNILTKSKIDLLVTDMRMPGVNGRQLFEQVRLLHPSLRILVMTAYGSSEVDEWLKGFGSVDYIEKPFEISELRERILSIVGGMDTNGYRYNQRKKRT